MATTKKQDSEQQRQAKEKRQDIKTLDAESGILFGMSNTLSNIATQMDIVARRLNHPNNRTAFEKLGADLRTLSKRLNDLIPEGSSEVSR